MTDITPKRSSEAWRGYVIHTRPWSAIVERYRQRVSRGLPLQPLLALLEAIESSPISSEVFGATSMFDVLLSDCADFRQNDSTLRISYRPTEHQFEFRHTSFGGHCDQKVCSESEALQTLRLFLRLKYGVLFEIPVAS
jgi:hypothetical protein